MPNEIDQAEELYVAARAAAHAVMLDLNCSDAQIAEARECRERMWFAYRESVLADIRSRTRLLTKLLTELTIVQQSAQINPLGDALDRINGVLEEVNAALEAQTAGAGGG